MIDASISTIFVILLLCYHPSRAVSHGKLRFAAMSDKLLLDSKIRSRLRESETALLVGDYKIAENISLEVINEIQGPPLESCEGMEIIAERAAVVFIQSVFETSKFSASRPLLCSLFSSLDNAPPNVILLWVSLALETEERRHADSLVLALLKSKAARRSGA